LALDNGRERSYDPAMAWRCPYCGTPQAESSRCWVCQRSTTTCATCRHFRRGVAAGLGMCGLDPKRVTLRGSEVRACWVPATGAGAVLPTGAPTRRTTAVPARIDPEARPVRTFVPVEELAARGEAVQAVQVTPAEPAPDPGTWSLWGDAEA
jgi:hypothetical protein